jgi:hypothetical protein
LLGNSFGNGVVSLVSKVGAAYVLTEGSYLTVSVMTDTKTRELCKAEVDRFLFGKHITACPVCGRFRSQCDVDVHTLTCQRADPSSTAPVNVLMIVCQNCGAIQFHDRSVIAQWLDCQKRVWVK